MYSFVFLSFLQQWDYDITIVVWLKYFQVSIVFSSLKFVNWDKVLWTCGYLSTQVEVAEQDCGLGASDEKNNKNQKQEPEHVVHLMWPEKNRGKQHITVL